MNSKLYRDRLLATTFFAGAAFAAAPAFAQVDPGAGATPQAPVVGGSSTTATPDNSNGTDASGNAAAVGNNDIVVTGSRIANPNLTSTSPLTVVNAQEVKLQGTTRVEDLLNSLPQVFASEGSTDANGASGIATVDLRDLGAVRTLVLVNGRRLVPGDPLDPVADLNFIPSSLIQRVEVLTGGASSIYGSDAVAGVVNFILNKDFEGVQLDAQYSFYNHDNDTNSQVRGALTDHGYGFPDGNTADGFQKNVTLTVGAGTDDGRGHVTAYASWRKVSAVTQGDRDFSSCGLSGVVDGVAGDLICGGSSTSANGRFRRTNNVALGATPVYSPTGPSFTVDPGAPGGNGFRTYNGGRDGFNFNPYNYFQRPDERYSLGAFAHYEVSPAFDPYAEVMFMDDRTLAQIAPSGAFYGTDFFVNCNNPFLSADQAAGLCGANAGTPTLQSVYIGRRNVEGGPRIDDLRHTDYRIVVGARGEIGKGISYDTYAQIGRAIFSERYQNDFSRVRLNRSLDVVTGPGGTPVCASSIPNAEGVVVDPNCVPYNIFSTNGVTPAAIDYLQTPGLKEGSTTEYVVSGSVTANLGEYGFQSPWATDGIGLSVGAEYRKESLELHNDIEFQTGDLAGQGTPFGVPDANGQFNVREVFGELNVPIVSDKPFFDSLSFDGSYRYSDYNIQGSTNTYKLGLIWAPVKDIKFRADYSRAVRAPNINELFTPATVGLFPSAGGDPCAGPIDDPAAATPTVNGNTLAQCARSGVTAADFGTIDPSPARQYNQRTAGNTNLKPEIGDTYTAGIVLSPRFLPNFVLSVDGYDIRIRRLISTVGADFSLSQCVASGNPFFCDRINRAAGGSLFTGNSFVDNPTENLGAEHTRGIDVNASYRHGIGGMGSLGFDLVGTYLDSFKVRPIAGAEDIGKYDCAGKFGSTCGTPLPRWRSKLRVTWTTPWNVGISGQWRYFEKVSNDLNSNNPLFGGVGAGNGNATDNGLTSKIKSQSYFDLSVTTRIADKYTFRIGAQNLLDKSPPLSPGYSSNGSNTFAQVYDSLGRYIYAGVTLDF